jgi:hypothetical protein
MQIGNRCAPSAATIWMCPAIRALQRSLHPAEQPAEPERGYNPGIWRVLRKARQRYRRSVR